MHLKHWIWQRSDSDVFEEIFFFAFENFVAPFDILWCNNLWSWEKDTWPVLWIESEKEEEKTLLLCESESSWVKILASKIISISISS